MVIPLQILFHRNYISVCSKFTNTGRRMAMVSGVTAQSMASTVTPLAAASRRASPKAEKVAGTIDDEVKKLMDKAYDHCKTILKKDEEKLRKVVAFLMEKETMTGQQFADCMEGKEIKEDDSKTILFDSFTEE